MINATISPDAGSLTVLIFSADRRAHGVDGRMRDALVLQHRNKIAIPCIGAEPRVVVDRNAQVIAGRRSRIGALQFILVVHRGPHSGGIEAHAALRRTSERSRKRGRAPTTQSNEILETTARIV